MIHPTSMISYLDISTGRMQFCTVEQFFHDYANRAIGPNSNRMINFHNEVKIKDTYGWTNVEGISKTVLKDPGEWFVLNTGDLHTKVSATQIIPIFFPNITKIGFHGRTKYAYHLHYPDEIPPGSRVRYGATVDPGNEFKEVYITEEQDGRYRYGYDIIVEGMMYQADSMLVYGNKLLDQCVRQMRKYGYE